jgi:uncharacterized protein (TIGR02996 family)
MRPSLPALRAAIRARPRDAGLRAVFADFLLERGDPRGLFIAAQREGRTQDAQRLLAKYRGHFIHPLPPWADVDFVDGFVDAWRTTPDEFRRAGRRMLRFLPLRSLTISSARQVDLQYLLESEGLECVTTLVLQNLRAGALELLAANDLPHVRVLQVSGALMESQLATLPDTDVARRLRRAATPPTRGRPFFWIDERFESPFAQLG